MDTLFDPSLENNIQQVLADAPQPIRDFFVARKTEVVTKNLMQKYGLHVDQSAILEREIILLLLGLKDPEEFSETLLQEAQLDERLVTNIMLDVNAQIFIPLREQLRHQESESRPQASGMRQPQMQQAPKAPPPPPPAYIPPAPKPRQPMPQPQAVQPASMPAMAAGGIPKRDTLPAAAVLAPRTDLAAAIRQAQSAPPPQMPLASAQAPSPLPPTPAPVMEAVRNAPINNPLGGLPDDRSAPQNGVAKTRPYSVDPYRELPEP